MKNIKISLEAARVNAGLTQKEAAAQLGITKQTLLNWEKGRSAPSIPQGREISRIYEMPMDFIFMDKVSN